MIYLPTLTLMAGVYLLAAASPGPNFFVITQLSLSGRRRLGIKVALGIAAGSTLWAILAMAGAAAVLARIDWLYAGIRLAGASYLVWLGLKLLWSARSHAPAPDQIVVATPLPGQAFRTGLMTSLTNPKAGVFWTSIFSSMYPVGAPFWLFIVTAVMIAALSAGWHLGLALVFSSGRVQSGYLALRRPIDAACGVFLTLIGIRMALSR